MTLKTFFNKPEELAGTSGGVLARLPSRENMKKQIRRERRKHLPPNPKSLDELGDLPEQYGRTFSGDNFLLYDSRAYGDLPNGRVLVFSTRRNIEILRECDVWSVDGTFRVG